MINITMIPYVAVSSLKILVMDDMGSDLVLMVKMEKLGHLEADSRDSPVGLVPLLSQVLLHATCLFSWMDLRSLKYGEKLRHVFHLVGNSPQTAELNTALDSPSYSMGWHGIFFKIVF